MTAPGMLVLTLMGIPSCMNKGVGASAIAWVEAVLIFAA